MRIIKVLAIFIFLFSFSELVSGEIVKSFNGYSFYCPGSKTVSDACFKGDYLTDKGQQFFVFDYKNGYTYYCKNLDKSNDLKSNCLTVETANLFKQEARQAAISPVYFLFLPNRNNSSNDRNTDFQRDFDALQRKQQMDDIERKTRAIERKTSEIYNNTCGAGKLCW
jgi:hypothetical protein